MMKRALSLLVFLCVLIGLPQVGLAALNLTVDVAATPTDSEQGSNATITLTLKNEATSDQSFNLSQLCNSGFSFRYPKAQFTISYSYRSTYCGSVATLAPNSTIGIDIGLLTHVNGSVPLGNYNIYLERASIPGASALVLNTRRWALNVVAPSGGGGGGEGTAFAALIDGGHVPTAGQWRNVPNSRLDTWTDGCDGTPGDKVGTPCQGSGTQIFVTNAEANAIHASIWGTQGSSSLLEVWTGAAYDPNRHQMFFHGGGHDAYRGNEVYVLDLDDLTLKRSRDPYPMTLTTPGGDAHPSKGIQAEHTYSAITYAPNTDEIWITMSGAQTNDDETIPGIWNVVTQDYIPNSEVLAAFSWGSFGSVYNSSCYNSLDGKIYLFQMRSQLGDVRRIDPVARTSTTLLSNSLGFEDNGGIVCYGNAVYMLTKEGSCGSSCTYRHRRYNIATNNWTVLGSITCNPTCSGGTIPVLPLQMGCDARPTANELVCWTGGNTIWRYNISANTWASSTPGGASTPTDPFGDSRVFTKWKYLEAIDTFIGVNQDNGSNAGLWLYRTSDSTWTAAGMTAFSFASKCARPGVVLCEDFDQDSDFLSACSDGPIVPASANYCTDGPKMSRDTVEFASGTSSAKCVSPAVSAANICGAWTRNFSPGTSPRGTSGSYPIQFGKNETFFVEWKQKMDANYLQVYGGGQGFKHLIIAEGDRPGVDISSCNPLEISPVNQAQRGVPQMYVRCPPTQNLEKNVSGTIYLQPEDSTGNNKCAYPGPYTEGAGCLIYHPDEWVTYRIKVAVGASYNTASTTIEFWRKRPGGQWQRILDRVNLNLGATAAVTDTGVEKYGAVWLMGYNTGRDGATYPVGNTWYDDLIVSTMPVD